jgi:hypothetical protein
MSAADPTREVRWLALDRQVRRRIGQAVRRGERVSDPQDAPLAVGYADAVLEWLAFRGRLVPFYLLFAVVLLLRLMITGRWHFATLVYPLLGFGFVNLRTPTWRRRLSSARDANAELSAGSLATPVQIALPGRAWLAPGRGRRRLVLVLGAVLAFLVYVVAASAFLVSTGGH